MLIGVEWTSANFAADLIGLDGTVVAEARHPVGVNAVKDRAFAERFVALVPADWLGRAEAVYFSGMVTGRGGWVETGFTPAPAGIEDIGAATVALPGGPVPMVFLPGVSAGGALPDVMRGEEIKALAAAREHEDAVVVMPGTHTKYVAVANGRIAGLATYMGGEIGNLLRRDSLVGRLIPPDSGIDAAGFARGLRAAWDEAMPGGVLRRLFSARSLVLFERMPAGQIGGYIAGLIAGAEIAEAEAEWRLHDRPVLVVGASAEADFYRQALQLRGIAAQVVKVSTAPSFAALHERLSRRVRSA